MNIKLETLFFLIFFIIFNNFLNCMDVKKEYSIEKADKQLLGIIKKINFTSQQSGAIAYNGGKVFVNWLDVFTEGKQSVNLYNTSCFDVRPLEEAVLEHMNSNLLKNKKYSYDMGKWLDKTQRPLRLIFLDWNGPVEKSALSLELLSCISFIKNNDISAILEYLQKANEKRRKLAIHYLLSNPKASSIPKEELIKKYVSLQDAPSYKCRFIDDNINIHFEKDLAQKAQFNNVTELLKNLDEVKEMIEGYLSYGAKITLPLRYCILYNNTLYKAHESDELLDISENFKEFTLWLLCKKEGWVELDELLVQTALKCTEYSYCVRQNNIILFSRCLALVKSYDMLNKARERMDNVFCKIAASIINTDFLQCCIDEKLVTQKGLDNAFLAILQKKYSQHDSREEVRVLKILRKAGANNLDEALLCVGKFLFNQKDLFSRNYVETIFLLLDWGADPNVLFYRDEQGIKKCYLEPYAWYGATSILIKVLFHPKRIREEDEMTDFQYLKNQKLSSIISMFGDNQKEKQQDLYDYGENVCKLGFEACKTHNPEDIQKLRQHIINYYERYEAGIFCNVRSKAKKTIAGSQDVASVQHIANNNQVELLSTDQLKKEQDKNHQELNAEKSLPENTELKQAVNFVEDININSNEMALCSTDQLKREADGQNINKSNENLEIKSYVNSNPDNPEITMSNDETKIPFANQPKGQLFHKLYFLTKIIFGKLSCFKSTFSKHNTFFGYRLFKN